MLGYRLVGKDTETPTQDFLAALTEARMQLDSIDKALDELDLTPFPKTISIMPEGDLRDSLSTPTSPYDAAEVNEANQVIGHENSDEHLK